jgi:Protein of unknown function (DUF2793)
MTFPKTGGTEWAAAQELPHVPVNGSMRRLDAAVSRWVVVDRSLSAAPGACADGANYLVAATPGGGDPWEGEAGKLATAVGTNASNGWLFTTVAVKGNHIYLQDESLEIEHDGSAWGVVNSTGATANVQASEDIDAGEFVNVFDSGGNTRVRLADATDPDKFANGYCLFSIANGDIGQVHFSGINSAIAVAAPASEVWLSETVPGAFQTTPPSAAGSIVQALGVALESIGVAFTLQSRIYL